MKISCIFYTFKVINTRSPLLTLQIFEVISEFTRHFWKILRICQCNFLYPSSVLKLKDQRKDKNFEFAKKNNHFWLLHRLESDVTHVTHTNLWFSGLQKDSWNYFKWVSLAFSEKISSFVSNNQFKFKQFRKNIVRVRRSPFFLQKSFKKCKKLVFCTFLYQKFIRVDGKFVLVDHSSFSNSYDVLNFHQNMKTN